MRLAAYLEKNNLTDAEFARRAGVHQSLVHRWKSGEKRPSLDTLEKIGNATDWQVTAEDFMPPRAGRGGDMESAA